MAGLNSELVVVADIHLAKNWDVVQDWVDKEIDFLNPNNHLKKLIANLNKDSNVAAVIFNGDCVDHFFADYLGFLDFINRTPHDGRPNNWKLFYGLIDRLNKPYVQVAGNHDYRLESYNYRFWDGLLRVNVPNWLRKKISKKIGRNSFRWIFEVNSVLVNEKKINPLKETAVLQSPLFKTLGGYNCIFLNTYYDGFAKLWSYLRHLTRLLTGHEWGVNVRGPQNSDIDFVKNTAAEQDSDSFYIFMHAPLINPKRSQIGKKYRLSITNFKKTASKQKIDYATILEGRGELLDIFRKCDKNLSIITSHAHYIKYFLIEKKHLTAKEVTLDTINQERENPCLIKHVVTPALGSISNFDPKRRIGYFKITPDGFKEVILKEYTITS